MVLHHLATMAILTSHTDGEEEKPRHERAQVRDDIKHSLLSKRDHVEDGHNVALACQQCQCKSIMRRLRACGRKGRMLKQTGYLTNNDSRKGLPIGCMSCYAVRVHYT